MPRKVIMLVVLVLLLSTGFGTQAQAQSAKVTIWATGSEDEGLVLKAAADAWSAKTGHQVEVVPISWDDSYTKILAAVTSQNGPDVITGGLSYGIDLGQKGGMVNISKEYGDDLEQIKQAANEGIWASIVAPDGSVYAVPWDLTIYLMYYRPDLLKEAGIDNVPQTWEELTTAIKAVQEKNDGKGGFAMQWGNTQWLYYSNLLYQAGGDFYDAECTKATINSPEGVQALEFYASLYKDYGAPKDGWPDLEGGLVSGLYPLGATGSWIAGGLEIIKPELKDKWQAAKLPAGPTGKSTAFIGGRVIGITSFSEVQDEAFDFIKFLYTEEAVEAQIQTATGKNIFYIPPQTEFQDMIQGSDNLKEAVKAQLAEAKGPPNCTGWESASKEVQRLLETVLFEDADPQFALDEAAAVMDEGLKEATP